MASLLFCTGSPIRAADSQFGLVVSPRANWFATAGTDGVQAWNLASGQLLANYGWSAVNIVVFPPVLLGLAVLTFASFAKRRRRLQPVDEFPEPSI